MGGGGIKPIISYSIDLDPRAGALRFHVCGLNSLPTPAAAAVHFTEKKKGSNFPPVFFRTALLCCSKATDGGMSGQNELCRVKSIRVPWSKRRGRRSLWSRVFFFRYRCFGGTYVPPPYLKMYVRTLCKFDGEV